MSKVCPLLLIAIKGSKDSFKKNEKEWASCLKETCAWYVSYEMGKVEGCSIENISNSLKFISMNLPKK